MSEGTLKSQLRQNNKEVFNFISWSSLLLDSHTFPQPKTRTYESRGKFTKDKTQQNELAVVCYKSL